MRHVAFSLLVVFLCFGCASQKPLTHDDFNRAIKNREYSEALGIINSIIAKNPDRAKSYVERGKTYLEMSRYDDAIIDFNKAQSLGYTGSDVFIHQATAYTELSRYDIAIGILNQEIAKKPTVFLYNALAYAFNKKGNFDKALELSNRVLSVDDKNQSFHNNRGLAYYGKGEYDKALDSFNAAIAIDPKFSRSYDGRGDVYLKLGNKDKAREDYKKACTGGLKRSCEKLKK